MRRLLSLPWPWLNDLGLCLSSHLEEEPNNIPDLIISSGGKSAFASLVLKRRYQAKSLFVGVPEPFPDSWFDLIVAPVRRSFGVPFLVSGLIPNTVTPEQVQAAGREYWQADQPESPCWALLIGGNSKSHHYSQNDWQGLVDGINRLGREFGVRWLITTSRRTPSEVGQLLSQKIDPAVVAEFVLYNKCPKRVVQPFLAAAQRVLVTQDSLTMASEALCSGRPVTLLAPEVLKVKQGSFFAEMLEHFPSLDGVDRIQISELPSYDGKSSVEFSVITLDAIGPELVEKLADLKVLNSH
jgi:mitochondrial fission protein ELM1